MARGIVEPGCCVGVILELSLVILLHELSWIIS